MKPFKNQTLTDFSKPAARRLMEKAILKVERDLGREYPMMIGGKAIKTEEKLRSVSPAEPGLTVGVFQQADGAIARKAVEAAHQAFQDWRFETPARRAAVLLKMAAIMRRRKFELCAWVIFEVGKSWTEAEAEVAQAIDFCEFYGRQALRFAGRQPLSPCPGEDNQMVYIPLGAGVVIAPWNFPLGLLTGMAVAALVCGNTVCLKPSSDSPATAAQFCKIAEEAGLPAGVLNFVTGQGSVAGGTMVEHPRTRFVAFTGSKDVGLRINQAAARMAPGQIWIKRVVLEMGGKDAIVVDSDADLDEAAAGVLASAYGFQGQKCSACSRAIVVKDVYDKFLDKLIPRIEALKVGQPTSPEAAVGPVINQRALDSILKYVETGRREGKLLTGGARIAREGFFIKPTLIAGVSPDATIAQEEIFGPVLAVIKARDYYHALEIANNTRYGLTGAVYTRDRRKIELAKQVFHVGNLYFNRRCTGFLVDAHPFGGFNLSGTDSKAGGRDYLLLFLQAKSMSEKLGSAKAGPRKARPRR